ncbi:MAG TPA: bifunctional DNA-binding transcriptional regulator/O6-methylguanine-DNA methyltransferase Ada [Blastocatellia bacterium]|nr:bifunctional DNA-binding transcriptional regulator/O6-methylguanine-DNA methyltransferase Ada [Blastocatellia bacterium]
MNQTTANPRTDFANEDPRWQAVLARDARFDGAFVFAVRSTGIYCRPSCPSRRARREQVTFFPLPEAAERAGFRSCLRCQPREEATPAPPLEAVRRACRHIEQHWDEPLTLQALASQVSLSPYHLQRVFKRIVGVSPREYRDALRVGQFKDRLKKGESVTAAMYEAGYGSSSRLYENSNDRLGMTPAVYRRGGHGVSISYTIAGCELGRLLVAATEKGLCAVRLGDSDNELEAGLRAEYSKAELKRDDQSLGKWVRALVDHLKGRHPRLELPLDVQATAFQLSVWQKLKEIPYGSTRSYSEVAEAIGRPSAVRAVARACATNPVALVIPCHRVVREDESLGGYRWGIQRKKALLERERG